MTNSDENKVNVYKFTGTDLVEFKQKLIDDVKNYFENELKRLIQAGDKSFSLNFVIC